MCSAKTIAQLIPAEDRQVTKLAHDALLAGDIVAIPTETVYGLAADATNDSAVEKVFKAKGRPNFNPLICHVYDIDMASQYVEIPKIAKSLMRSFWPGPLTLVLPQKLNNHIARSVSAGLPTLAVRCPASSITRDIIKKLNRPIAAPSANLSGKLSPTTAKDVINGLGSKIDLVIDAGPCQIGIESTIIAISNDEITLLRPGSVTVDEITEKSGKSVKDRDGTTITAPGQMASHYAPNTAIKLNKSELSNDNFLIGFNKMQCDINLSESGNLSEAAANLFTYLHIADASNKDYIAVAPIPNKGIGIAINDRLKRAAAPRDLIESNT